MVQAIAQILPIETGEIRWKHVVELVRVQFEMSGDGKFHFLDHDLLIHHSRTKDKKKLRNCGTNHLLNLLN